MVATGSAVGPASGVPMAPRNHPARSATMPTHTAMATHMKVRFREEP